MYESGLIRSRLVHSSHVQLLPGRRSQLPVQEIQSMCHRGHELSPRMRSGIIDICELIPASIASWVTTRHIIDDHSAEPRPVSSYDPSLLI
jgi:hypothetical protein